MRNKLKLKLPKKLYLVVPISGVLLLLVFWLWSVSPDTVFRIIRYNTSGIDDYMIFPRRLLEASQTPFNFDEDSSKFEFQQAISFANGGEVSLGESLRSNDTVAFLVVKDDTILFEKYYDGYDEATPTLSFSVAKSFLSILIGCAIDDGYIQSVDQPVTSFVPELAKNGYNTVTIKHLLQMTSGMDYIENDNPFGIHPRFYYTSHLESELLKLQLADKPGQ